MNNKSQIMIIGTGYVGLITSVCFAELGFKVICIDKDKNKINQLKSGHCPIYEPLLSDLMIKNVQLKRLQFTHLLNKPIVKSTYLFITVGTPMEQSGEADITDVENIIKTLAPLLNEYKVIVIKSTVPVGTSQHLMKLIRVENPKAQFDLVSNPEFLRAGSGIKNFMQPDRIIIGIRNKKSYLMMKKLYQFFLKQNIPILFTDCKSAELIKYAANCFLATKIAYTNELAYLCERLNTNVDDVLQGVGLDKRIGHHYLKPGPGLGGSCLVKDALAFNSLARRMDATSHIIQSTLKANVVHKNRMIKKIINACSGSVANKRLAILGISFKANTDDIRNSMVLYIISELQLQGAFLTLYDPVVKQNEFLPDQNVVWHDNIYICVRDVDVILVMTEWGEFKALNLKKVFTSMRKSIMRPTLIDFRNLYSPLKVTDAGFCYISLGRTSNFKKPILEVYTN